MENINEILVTDYNKIQEIEILRNVIKTLQSYIKKECDDDLGASPFDFFEEALTPDWKKYWAISDEGSMKLNLTNGFSYSIDKNRLISTCLLSDILGKNWEETRESEIVFYAAYLEALKKIGLKTVKIDLESEEWSFE